MQGRCIIKRNIKEIINGVNFGQGKRFDYKFISENVVLVYKKGIQAYIDKNQFYKYFRIRG